jgi:hypothetical protein
MQKILAERSDETATTDKANLAFFYECVISQFVDALPFSAARVFVVNMNRQVIWPHTHINNPSFTASAIFALTTG